MIWNIDLIDQSRLFAEGLKMLMAGSNLKVGRYFSSLTDFTLADDNGERPHLVLVGASSSLVEGGAEAAALSHICARLDSVPVVLLCESLSVDQLRLAMRVGAAGYLLRSISADALKYSLSLAIAGEKVVPSELINLIVARHSLNESHRGPTGVKLSARERAILRCIANGSSNKQIANTLEIAEGTVKVHVKAVFAKVGARNRTDAAVWALGHVPDVSD